LATGFTIARLPRTLRNLQRIREIVAVIIKYGFDDVVFRLGLTGLWERTKYRLTFGRFGLEDVQKRSTEERIRLALEDLGPTYIKFGQILATRPDLVPMSLIHELRKLQDRVPPFGSADAKRTIEEDLGCRIDEVFAEFDDRPLAAASIAQVHRARLKAGDEVAVKVQRPNLRKIIDTDLELLRLLAELAEDRIPELKRWQPVAVVEEFDKSIHKEIDFEREAHNVKKFKKNFEGDAQVYAPRVYEDLSTDKVLTLEFIRGVKMTSEEIFTREDLDREAIARAGIRITLTQTFVHGFFHADPHPGNIFVMPGNIICLLDFGMMGILDQERIDDLLGFLVALLTKNVDRMLRLFLKQGLISEATNLRALKSEIYDLIDRYYEMEIMKVDVARYIGELFDIITRHRIILPPDLLLMGKALATIDGIARDIYPELDPISAIRPQILQIYFQRLADPTYHSRDTVRALEEGVYFLQRLPRDLRVLTTKLRDGEFQVKYVPDGPGFDRCLLERSRSGNRLAAAVLIVGMFAASGYLLVNAAAMRIAEPAATLPSVLTGLGIWGLVVSALFGLGFLIGVLRSGGQ